MTLLHANTLKTYIITIMRIPYRSLVMGWGGDTREIAEPTYKTFNQLTRLSTTYKTFDLYSRLSANYYTKKRPQSRFQTNLQDVKQTSKAVNLHTRQQP